MALAARSAHRYLRTIMNVNAPMQIVQTDIQGLAQAISSTTATDGLRCQFSQPHWDILAAHMQAFSLASGQVLIERGTVDRSLYFVESGVLHLSPIKGINVQTSEP